MSTIGKIFLILNLVLAAVFVGWAAKAVSETTDWKKKHETEVANALATKTQLEAEVTKLRASGNQLESDLRSATNERDEAKRAYQRTQTDLTAEQTKNKELNTSVSQISTTLQGIEDRADKAVEDSRKAMLAQQEAEAGRRAAEAAQAAAEAAQNDAQTQLASAQEMIASLEKEKTTLAKERSSLQTSYDTVVSNTGVNANDFQNVPKIDGAVLGVETKVAPGLVAINVGSTKGVKRGYTFEIYSGNTYKGQVRVEFVHADMCSGLIVRTVPGQTIRQGDGATTRL